MFRFSLFIIPGVLISVQSVLEFELFVRIDEKHLLERNSPPPTDAPVKSFPIEMSGSGGDRKKRISRGTGWEEAGGEFYQESYPGAEIDFESIPRDPHYFATLLPSKQNRAATTRKPKTEHRNTIKKRTETRARQHNTMAQNTIPNDIHVAMMPDLSENLANEETTWEEMMMIKAMPVPMSQKKEIKAKLLSADTFRLQGFEQFKWRRRKLWEFLKVRRKEIGKKLQLWRKCILTIEGNFGSGVAAFFLFIKWLMFLNLTITVLLVCFVIVPTLLMRENERNPCWPSNGTTSVECCSMLYESNVSFSFPTPYELAQGTGWLESSYMFYGAYPNSILEESLLKYNLPVAYIATAVGYLLLSLCAIIKAAASGFRDRLIESEGGQYYRYCNMVFSGWDLSIYNERSAVIKHKALFYEMKDSIETERRHEDNKHRTKDEACKSFFTRTTVNLIVFLILAASGSLIYFTFQFSLSELQRDFHTEEYKLFLEFAPSLCIIGLNLIIPNILNYLVSLENYSAVVVVRVTLFRTILLRLSSLGVLLASFYSLVRCRVGAEESCVSSHCRTPLCWETYVGQQLYKLLILDITSHAVVTFFVNFPRMLIAKHVKCKLARIIGSQEFELPKHVLDVVYSQTLVWFGSFYAPLLPAIATVLFFLVFYIKKFACLVNSSPSTTIYRASRSDSMFMSVLLVSFTVAIIPWAFTMSEIEPSRSCGPFRGRPTVWSLLQQTYTDFPVWFKKTVVLINSSTFAVPALIASLSALYYYYIISKAHREMVEVLKKQLVLEGHDKQFLLNRLSAFIKQHQERHNKAARSVDPPTLNN